jgi:hypothetical protein
VKRTRRCEGGVGSYYTTDALIVDLKQRTAVFNILIALSFVSM